MPVQNHNFADDFDEAVLKAAARLLREDGAAPTELIAAALDEVAGRRRMDSFHTAALLKEYRSATPDIKCAEEHGRAASPISRVRHELTMFIRNAVVGGGLQNDRFEMVVSDIERTERVYLEKLQLSDGDDTGTPKISFPQIPDEIAVSLKSLQSADWKKAVIGDGNFDHLQRLAGGLSKTTFAVGWSEGATRNHLIIRQDVSTSVVGKPVADEIRLVNLARSGGVPVPRVLHLEDRANNMGEPYAIMEFIEGRPGGTPYLFKCTRAAVLDFARVLALLHKVQPSDGAASLHEFGSPADMMRHRIDDAWKEWCQGACVPSPIIECAFLRLMDNCHFISDERRLVHRDAGPHNILVAGDQVVSLLDWELAGFGDPVEDLAYCKGAVEKVVPWPTFMDAYIHAGGESVEPDRFTFFEYWASLRNASLNAIAMRNFMTGSGTDQLGIFTAATVPFLERRLAKIARPLPIGAHGRL